MNQQVIGHLEGPGPLILKKSAKFQPCIFINEDVLLETR